MKMRHISSEADVVSVTNKKLQQLLCDTRQYTITCPWLSSDNKHVSHSIRLMNCSHPDWHRAFHCHCT